MKLKKLFQDTIRWDNKAEILDDSTVADKTWSSQKISQEVAGVTLEGYDELVQDLSKVTTELGTNRTKIIENLNKIIDIL